MSVLNRGYEASMNGLRSAFGMLLLAIVAGLMFQAVAYADVSQPVTTITSYTSGYSDGVQNNLNNSGVKLTDGTLEAKVNTAATNTKDVVFQFPVSSLPATNEIVYATINLYINQCYTNVPLRFRNATGNGTVGYDPVIEIDDPQGTSSVGTITTNMSGWVTLDVTASIKAAKAAGYTWATYYLKPIYDGIGGAKISVEAAESTITTQRPYIATVVNLYPPVATAATSVTGTSFVANWDASVGATNYFIDVATNATFGGADFVAAYSNVSVGGGTSVTVSNLVGRRDYAYRLRAQGTSGTNPTNSNTISLSLPQNKPVANDDVITILEDSTPVVVTVLTNDVDADLDPLLIFSVTPGTGTVTVNAGQLDATWYSPAADWNGQDTFSYKIVDGTVPDGFDTAMVTVNVTPVNDMPSFVGGTNSIIVNEDCGPQTSAGWATAISAGPVNESGQVLTFIVENDNPGLFASLQPAPDGRAYFNGGSSSQPAVSPDGTLTFTPAADSNGVANVSVWLVDDATAGGGALTAAVQTLTITVNPVNDAPSFTKGADITVDEDCGPQWSNGWATAISAGPSNEPALSLQWLVDNSDLFPPLGPKGQRLTFIVENDNNGLFSPDLGPVSARTLFYGSQPTVSPDGTLTFMPADDSNGVANVSVWLVDDDQYGGGAITTAVQTFTITVNPINDDPVAVTDVATTPEDTPVVINVVTNDTDVDGDGVLIYSITQGTNGSVVVNPGNESVTYTAAVTNWHGSDMFTYLLVDGEGGVATGKVNVTVSPVNDMPSFTKGVNITVDEDSGSQYSNNWATAISAGPTNESGQSLTFIVENDNPGLFASLLLPGGKAYYNGGSSSQPAVSPDGTLSFRPAADSNGVANVSIWLVDDATAGGGALTTAVQTCTITVNPIQDVPIAVNDDSSTAVAMPLVINVLANDIDVDGDSLVIDSFTQGSNGVVTANPGNTSLTYSPMAAWTGTDTFEYVIDDKNGGYATGMVTVVVAPQTALDFDGDGQSDFTVLDPMSSTWYVQQSNLGDRQEDWGWDETIPVPADYDGDGSTDLAVYNPATGTWYIIPSGGGAIRQQVWGWNDAIPVPADYDGDGQADLAVYYPATGTWYIVPSGGGAIRQQAWGWNDAVPVPADYDGDGKADLAVYYPAGGTWYIIPSGGGANLQQAWGWSEAVPVPADYDGDGKTDLAVYYPAGGTWYIIPSGGGANLQQAWGWSEAIPAPADYDGDGKADLTVYYPGGGTWYTIPSGGGSAIQEVWGPTGTEPVFKQYQINLWMGL